MIKFYNSLTNKVEEFIPIKENEVSMYVCGPTVYNYAHIGNTRPEIFFDIVSRFFKYMGYKVTHISNYTDIDDKIIKKALEEGVSEEVISKRYIKAYEDLIKGLNCLPKTKNPKVTQTMDSIIKFIDGLVQKNDAYVVDGDVFFDVTKAKDYGVLSGQTIENLMVGARIDENTKKHSPMDFALWKKTDQGVKWPSPWGEGRPGWHTECVVMIDDYYHNVIDIHGGGMDLKFPHHDNEIAQASCMFNRKLANYWLHNGRVDLVGTKMSKSLGNVIWAQDLLDKIGYHAYRLLIINTPYRQMINYSDELVNQAISDATKIKRTYISLFRKIELETTFEKVEVSIPSLVSIKKEFIEAMSNDFNTPNALTALFKLMKAVNLEIRQKDITSETTSILNQMLKLYDEFLFVLGLEQNIQKLNDEELFIVNEWKKARANKDFEKADIYRNKMNEKEIEL